MISHPVSLSFQQRLSLPQHTSDIRIFKSARVARSSQETFDQTAWSGPGDVAVGPVDGCIGRSAF
jgi:hypothetical protein